ncbi:sensor domain-containing diguanylate cyclase [Synechococcus sp. CB0101]|uniref:GGDEF domain-containing protein n=1 Tax=Synechococcus sp. CB0101 TaxID=232348 RepID=UPI0002E9770C|nr:sensor domain-containing diguanylate cyclase [Synechococcus sp. CB0101]
MVRRREGCCVVVVGVAMTPYPDYPIPANEEQRLRALRRFAVLDTPEDPHFARIVELASAVLGVPIALVSLVDRDRQWFLARHGLQAQQTPRAMAFCAHAIAEQALMEVPDALDDARFNTNPLVLDEPKIRFYAGVPLRTEDGYNLGTLCAIDRKPRVLDPHQRAMLQLMADLVMRELELRQRSMQCPVTGLYNRSVFFRFGEQEFEQARDECTPLALFNFDIDDFRQINMRWGHQAGDQVLLDLCAVVQKQLGHEDLFGRIGDEEFSVLLVNASMTRAMALAESIRQAIAAMRGVFDQSDYHPNISGGITALADTDQSFADLFYRADQALYLAKGNGRNQVASLLVD